MNILWVTPQLPCRRSGGQVRQYYLLQHLCQRHQITVLSLVQPAEQGDIQALRDLGAEVVTVSFVPPIPPDVWRNRLRSWTQLLFDLRPHYAHIYPLGALRRRLHEILARSQPEIVHLEHLFTAPLGETIDALPWVLVEQNIESRRTERQGKQAPTPTRRLAGWIEMQKLRRWEQMWAQRSAGCIAVSEADAADLRTLAPDTPVFVVPNGVDTTYFAPPDRIDVQRAGLLFFGTLGYAPNTDAVTYFCREILPHVRSSQPDVTLDIVGPHAPSKVVALAGLRGVRYVGFVEDVRVYLWRAAVCVAPLRVGGGTRLKILEALAAGCPVVSTTIGAEGLDLSDGQDLLIADDPPSFAQRVVELLENNHKARCLAEHGQQTVAARYDWRAIAPRLEEAYYTVHYGVPATMAQEHGRAS